MSRPAKPPIDAARRECLEEIGVAPHALVPMFGMLPSPGMSDEHRPSSSAWSMPRRSPSAPARRTSRKTRGRSACRSAGPSKRWRQGGLQYGAAVLGLQWLALNRTRLAEIARGDREMSAILVAVDGPQAGRMA